MPGVSGELKLQAVPIRGGLAKLPGEVPCFVEEGLLPSAGSSKKFLLDMARPPEVFRIAIGQSEVASMRREAITRS